VRWFGKLCVGSVFFCFFVWGRDQLGKQKVTRVEPHISRTVHLDVVYNHPSYIPLCLDVLLKKSLLGVATFFFLYAQRRKTRQISTGGRPHLTTNPKKVNLIFLFFLYIYLTLFFLKNTQMSPRIFFWFRPIFSSSVERNEWNILRVLHIHFISKQKRVNEEQPKQLCRERGRTHSKQRRIKLLTCVGGGCAGRYRGGWGVKKRCRQDH
jgi:hypothetical protein